MHGLASAYQILAEYYRRKNNIDSMLIFAHKAYQLATAVDDMFTMSNMSITLADYYDNLKTSPDSVLKYLRIYIRYNNSLYNDKSRKELNKI